MIAMATAASEAATAITNNEKKCPCNLSGYKYLLKAKKFIFTELRINSTDIKIVIRFFRVKKPYTPTKNIMVLKTKKYCNEIPVFIFLKF
jgi:hypothetical protein